MYMKRKNVLTKAAAVTGSLQVTVIGVAILAVLVVWGTLYQVNNGLYAAQERFFNAWFTLIGGYMPFPAVKTVVAVLSVNLLAAAFRKRPLSVTTAGVIIMHIGVAALIGGAAVTSNFLQESTATLTEGQQTSEAYDFATWILSVSVNGTTDGKPYSKIIRYDLRQLREGQTLALPPMDAAITIHKIYRNCTPELSTSDRRMITGITPAAGSTERGQNIPGITFLMTGNSDISSGWSKEQFAYAGASGTTPIACGTGTAAVSLEPLALPLPLTIALKKFTVEWHPGTSKAKRYESRLRVLGKNIDRDIVIEMNRPFRYRSFTFYQMGYSDQNGKYASTLAIVKNPLRYLPYMASLIIVGGLILHFLVKMGRHLSLNRSNPRE